MRLGMIGLGRMGANIVRRLIRHGHTCVAYDKNAELGHQLASEGAVAAAHAASVVLRHDSFQHIEDGLVNRHVDHLTSPLHRLMALTPKWFTTATPSPCGPTVLPRPGRKCAIGT